MPPSAITGFVKKRTAAQRYKRSPRQLTRDITLAIELQDENVLPHLRIRAEDGEVISGDGITSDLIKRMRDEGRNPMRYLRRTWLEESFGRREKGDHDSAESEYKPDIPHKTAKNDPRIGDGLTEMLKESIRELKQDKEHLKTQLAIKDDQITQTTERWKESNILTQNLHKRIDTMEQQVEQLLLGAGDATSSEQVADVIIDSGSQQEEGTADNIRKPSPRREPKSSARAKTTKQSKTKKHNAPKPKWFETPTLNRLTSRFRPR